MTSSHDLIVIGAGPVGALAAHAFAQRGARVALLEARPNARARLAGEWIHPPGVEVLDRLRAGRLEDQGARAGYGFAVLPDDGSPPIELPYPGGAVALACEHRGIVASLRGRAIGHAGVTYLPGRRAVAITERGVIVESERGGSRHEVRAARIVGADGRSSLTARYLGAGEGELQSYTAAVELRGVELPREGFGHVVLGGPGPALLYRLDDDRVRACLDVPLAFGGAARTPQFLWDGFGPAFPPGLREALRRALERGKVMWAANRFRPRAHYRSARVIAIGDAVGHCHPLTAIGLTQGFLDAEAAASEPASYPEPRARESYAAELLASALYHVLRRDDRCASAIRAAVYDAWRANAALREHSMQLLMGGARRSRDFGATFARIAAAALAGEVLDTRITLGQAIRRAASFRQWLPWGVAAVVPHAIRSTYRGRTTATAPLPGFHGIVDEAEAVTVAPAPGRDRERLARARAGASDALRRLLSADLAAGGGLEGEAAWARRAAPILHALERAAEDPAELESTRPHRARLATASLASCAVAHARGDRARVAADLAQLLIALLDAPPARRGPIAGLERAVRDLAGAQARDGAFGDPLTTELACRALRLVRATRAGGDDRSDRTIAHAQARAARWLRARQREDGAQPGPEAIASTAAAIAAWIACGVPATDPAVRRAVRWLVRQQTPRGAWPDARGAAASALVTARAVGALALANGHFRGARELGAAALADLVSSTLLDRAGGVARASRRGARADPRRGAARAGGGRARGRGRRAARPGRPPRRPAGRRARRHRARGADDEDLGFCRAALQQVSRTFARPIAMLPEPLSTAVGCGYLLCRIADTIEDHPEIRLDQRERLFGVFLETLDGGAPHALARGFEAIAGDDAELSLGRSCARVLRVLDTLDRAQRAACRRWIAEMARGMNVYVHRQPGPDGLVALATMADLERYCYFVAGTVGHLLTDLFGTIFDPAIVPALRVDAERFGTGLQLVNILKDVTEDRARGWSYIPRSACAEHGIEVRQLVDPAARERAHAAVAPVFAIARERLDGALRYALAVPPAHTGVRLFCLLPLWLAVRTLVRARGNDAMFVTGAEVKISRAEVEALITEVTQLAGDDDALARRYRALWERP